MAANYNPIFPKTPDVKWATLTNGYSLKDGTVGSTVFTANGEGARIDQIKIRNLGTGTTTVVRLYVNNGGAVGTASNNSLIHEVTINNTTGTDTASQPDYDVTISKGSDVAVPIPYLPPYYSIRASLGTTVATGIQVTVHGGQY